MSKQNLQLTSATQMMNPFNEGSFKEKFELALTEEFLHFETKANELVDISGKITCNNNDEAAIAKARILDANQWIKMMTDKHKDIKAPLLAITRILDAKKKVIEDKLETAKKAINGKITFYDTLEKQKENERLQKIREQKLIEDQKVFAETSRLDRLVRNVRALLYGGDFASKDGVTAKPGCYRIEEVEYVEAIVSKSLPGPAEFSEKSQLAYQESIKLINEMIIARKQAVLTTGGTVLSDKEAVILSETGSVMENQGQRLTRENEKIERQLEKTEKGFRREIACEVYDLNLVPREFLSFDMAKFNEWKTTHRDEVLRDLKAGVKGQYAFIPGVKILVTQSTIVR